MGRQKGWSAEEFRKFLGSECMKKILAMAAAAALAAGISASAANPFSDVPTDSWAYQAVADLSEQGVVEGYPDGTFKGEKNVTRYEIAQIVARLMAKEDQLNAEQQATLDKLAGEYTDELANLGVRVSSLEKKVGNISWAGNARMRFWQDYSKEGKSVDNWDGRIRLIAKGQINDSTYAMARFRTNMDFKSNGTDGSETYTEVLEVHHQFGDNFGVTLGRQDLFLGQTGLEFDDEFDGAIATYNGGAVNLDIGYGSLYYGALGNYSSKDDKGNPIVDKNDSELFLARLYGDIGSVSYDVEYLDGKDSLDASLFGAGATIHLSDFSVFGDYYTNMDYEGDPKTWTAGIGYSTVDWNKPGTWGVTGQYVRSERGSFIGDGTYNSCPANLVTTFSGSNIGEVKYWLATADIILMKNLDLHADYAFNVKADKGANPDDVFSVELDYRF